MDQVEDFFRKKIRKELEENRRIVLQKIKRAQRKAKEEIRTNDDTPDDTTIVIYGQTIGTLIKLLRSINKATKRLEQGVYGKCEICGEGIPLGRLEIEPYAVRCTPCAEYLSTTISNLKKFGSRVPPPPTFFKL